VVRKTCTGVCFWHVFVTRVCRVPLNTGRHIFYVGAYVHIGELP